MIKLKTELDTLKVCILQLYTVLMKLNLLSCDAVTVEVEDKNSGSALRALKKLSIDYEIVD